VANENVLEVSERQQDEMQQFQEHVASRPEITIRLEAVLRTLFEQQREAFVEAETERYLLVPRGFLAGRKATETMEEYFKRVSGWPKQKDQSHEAQETRSMILRSLPFLKRAALDLTTEPDTRKDTLPGFWKDRPAREDWLDNPESRKNFRVKMRPDAEDVARKRANALAEAILQQFLYKTQRKLWAILKRHPQYFAQLVRGSFHDGAIEGDVRLTFPDTKSFVVHLIVKQNHSINGQPFTQYPLTWHDVYGGPDTTPIKQVAQEGVEELFGVAEEDRWHPQPYASRKPKGPRFSTLKTNDVVQIKGKSDPAFLLGKDRKKEGNYKVLLAGEEQSVSKGKIVGVAYRLTTGYQEVREHGKKSRLWFVEIIPAIGEPDKLMMPGKINDKCDKCFGDGYGNWRGKTRRVAFDWLCKRRYFLPPSRSKRQAVPA